MTKCYAKLQLAYRVFGSLQKSVFILKLDIFSIPEEEAL